MYALTSCATHERVQWMSDQAGTPRTTIDAESVAKIFTDVLQCRAITDAQARLACYDRSVGALAQAQQRKDVFVADKEAIGCKTIIEGGEDLRKD